MEVLNSIYKDYQETIRKNWLSIPVLIISCIIGFLFCVFFVSLLKISYSDIGAITMYSATISILLCIWYYNRFFVIKAPNDKISLYLSISTQDGMHKKRLTDLLINSLRIEFNKSVLNNKFKLIALSEFHVSRIDTNDKANLFLRKSKGNFILRGRAIEANKNGEQTHFLEIIDWRVSHKSIPLSISNNLSKEFDRLKIDRFNLPFKNDLEGFLMTSELITHISKYLIAVSLVISDYIEEGLVIFEELAANDSPTNITTLNKNGNRQIKIFNEHVRIRIFLCYYVLFTLKFDEWWTNRNKDAILQIRYYVAKINALGLKLGQGEQYELNQVSAICYFILDRDVKSALGEYKKCSSVKEGSWRYGVAFLYAYQKNIKRAQREYEIAFSKSVEKTVIIQCDEFISGILVEEPDKIQLHFFLGLLNLKMKGDLVRAEAEFNHFLSRAGEDPELADLVVQASMYISKIRANSI